MFAMESNPPVPLAAPAAGHRRWLVLAVQLPAHPSNGRVKIWRRLQELGAVAVKHAVYVLPDSAQALEDFSWLRAEVSSLGGHAALFAASSVDLADDDDIVRQFRSARQGDYTTLLSDIRQVKPDAAKARGGMPMKELRTLRSRADQLRAIDFFSAPGRDRVDAALSELEQRLRRNAPRDPPPLHAETMDRGTYRGRVWATRPRPGVDRFASAWLIRRFIDPDARFEFVDAVEQVPAAVPFDMFGRGFSHEGGRCTFEVLQHRFGIEDAAVRRIAEIVHDVDLKDEHYRPAQAPTIAVLIEGLRSAVSDDHELLRQGMQLFEALYQGMPPSSGGPATPKKCRR